MTRNSPRARIFTLVTLVAALLLSLPGCRDAPPPLAENNNGPCPAGQVGCACYGNMTCDSGGHCAEGVCEEGDGSGNSSNNVDDPNNTNNDDNAGTNNNDMGGCDPFEAQGSAGCACYANQTCNDDLRCVEGACAPCPFGAAGCPCGVGDDPFGCEARHACVGDGRLALCEPLACVPADCDDGNPCTTEMCDDTDACLNVPRDSGPCDDEDPCTEGDACAAGVCAGDAKSCSDDNACTTDTCNRETGACVNEALREGEPCDDADACTADDACKNGLCQGDDLDCDDGIPCTADTCDAAEGCENTARDLFCEPDNVCSEAFCDVTQGCISIAEDDGASCVGPRCTGLCYAPSRVSGGRCDDPAWSDLAGTDAICARDTDINGDCLQPMNHQEADGACAAVGGRLCSLAEVIVGETVIENTHPTCDGGCGSDCTRTWTSTACNDAKTAYFTIPGDVRFHNPDSAIPCTPQTGTLAFVCCADAAAAPRPPTCVETAPGRIPISCE